MDLTGRPLLDTKADNELFVDRGIMTSLRQNAERGLNTLLLGERGAGKTSLMRQLAYRLRESRSAMEPVFVEGSLAEDEKTFLDLVRYRLGLRLTVTEPAGVNAFLAQMASRRVVHRETVEILDLIRSLAEGAGERRKVILVDQLPAPIAHTLFGRLRDEVWQLPFTWIVAGDESERGRYLAPPADAFFDVVVEIPRLTQGEQRQLLKKRLGDEVPVALEALVGVDEGNPRRLLALTRDTLDGEVGVDGLVRALSARDSKVRALGRSATMLVAEMEALGPVSASDDRLLDRLGWTRERAVQILRKLEKGGIVASSPVKGRSGRPRKVYQLRKPSEL